MYQNLLQNGVIHSIMAAPRERIKLHERKKSGHGTIFLRLRPHGRSVSVIASRVLIWFDLMVTMRNSGTGQLTIDGYPNPLRD